MAKKMTLKELQATYIGLDVYVHSGMGKSQGSRILYLEDCDGAKAVVWTTVGERKILPVEGLKIDACLDRTGREIPHLIETDGWLVTIVDGERNRVCPWAQPVKRKKGRKYKDDDPLMAMFD